MKILTAVFIFEIIFADNQACPIEMYVFLTNVNEPVTISIIPLSTVWDDSFDVIIDGYNTIELSDSFDVLNNNFGCDYVGSVIANPSCVTDYHPNGYGILPYGRFKVISSRDNGFPSYYFYLNTLDSDYPYSIYGANSNDFSIKDDSTKFYWEENSQDSSADVTQQISPNSEMYLWQLCGKNDQTPNQARFQPTIPEGLTYSNTNNHPDIKWRRSEPYNGNVTYKVKRKNPNQSNYSVIASGLTDTTFIDTDVDICCGSQLVQYKYKIEAISGDGNKTSGDSFPLTVRVKEGSTVKKELLDAIPSQFSIKTFPNPFNPVTTIKYDIPEQSIVQLTIFDLLGRKINTLKNKTEDAGFYSIKWNGTDENGNSLSSGMYIIHISAQSLESEEMFTQSHKVVFLK